jgi:hypothetical protein
MTAPRSYETERAAMAAMHVAVPPDPDRVILSQEQRQQYLYGVLEAAGVVGLSALEGRTAWWLCGWEDYTIAIIARWVQQAREAGKAAPRTVTIDVSDANAYHVLTEALEMYAAHERAIETDDHGRDFRERWASLADRWRGLAEDAVQAAEGEAQS